MEKEILINGIPVIPLIVWLIQITKSTGMKPKYSPFVAIIFGIMFGFFINGFTLNTTNCINSVVTGLYLAFSAMGLYSGTSSTIENFARKENDEEKSM